MLRNEPVAGAFFVPSCYCLGTSSALLSLRALMPTLQLTLATRSTGPNTASPRTEAVVHAPPLQPVRTLGSTQSSVCSYFPPSGTPGQAHLMPSLSAMVPPNPLSFALRRGVQTVSSLKENNNQVRTTAEPAREPHIPAEYAYISHLQVPLPTSFCGRWIQFPYTLNAPNRVIPLLYSL